MMTYNTLADIEVNHCREHSELGAHLTAGARAESATVPKPAARTAVACSSPRSTRTPVGMLEIEGLPISRMRKKNQSVALEIPGQYRERLIPQRECLLEKHNNCKKEPCLMRGKEVYEATSRVIEQKSESLEQA